jgi:hypothetical protein
VNKRRAAVLAWGLFALYVVVWAPTMGIVLFGSGGEDGILTTLVVGYVLVGALVATRLPANPIGWLLLFIGLWLSLGALADANVRSADAPLMSLSAWFSAWGWFAWLIVASVFLPLLFPTGRPPSPRWRPVLWLGAVALAFSVLGNGLKPGTVDTDSAVPVENPIGIAGAKDVLSFMADAGNLLALLAFVLAAASLVVRFRRSSGRERLQLKWFAYAGLLVAGGLFTSMMVVLVGNEDEGPSAAIGAVGWFTVLFGIVIAIPVATGVAILRHRLFDIDVVIRRTLVYAGLTAALLLSYLAAVLLLGLALSPLTEQSDLAIAGSTLAVAALFRPLRVRIQAAVDRRFFRRRFDARRTIEQFGSRLRDEVELDAVSAQLRAAATDTMQPSHVSVWLRDPEVAR